MPSAVLLQGSSPIRRFTSRPSRSSGFYWGKEVWWRAILRRML